MKMKYHLPTLAIIMILWPQPDLSAAMNDYLKYFRTDSAYVYSYNASLATWIPSSVQKYQYVSGSLTNVYTLDYYTRADQGRSEYSYNDYGQPESVVNYYYSNGWVAATRNLYAYNEYGQITEIRVQKYSNSTWADDRIQTDYVYDLSGNLTEYRMFYWRNNQWTSPTTDYSYYDETGKLIRREAFYSTGVTDYRILYEYNEFSLISEIFAEYPVGTGWNNLWKADYQYNPCGLKISQIQYAGSGDNWIPNTKTVSFTYFKPELYPERRISVCHNGKTITLRATAVQEHLNHGDCLGPCPDSYSQGEDRGTAITTNTESPFTIYPNPAGEEMTVTLKHGIPDSLTKIELLDFRGNILRTVFPSGTNQVTIPRNGLAGGQYFLRVYAGDIYSIMVIFR